MDVYDVLLWLGALVGHLCVVVFLYNRAYSWVIGHGLTWRMSFVGLLGLLVPATAFVVWLVVMPTDTFAWTDLPVVMLGYVMLCWLGLAGLAAVTLWRATRSTPRALLANRTRVIDVAERLGRLPRGASARARMLHLPGNQACRVELNDVHLALRRVPDEWDGLSILHLSDLHLAGALAPEFYDESIAAALDPCPDLVVVTGDVTTRPDCIPLMLGRLGDAAPRCGKFAVTGNHDYWGDQDETRARLRGLGFAVVDGVWTAIEIAGRTMVVCGDNRPWPAHAPAPDLTGAPADAFGLCLTHTPDNVRWAREHDMDLVLSGHTHGGQIRLPLVGATYCPSLYGRRYDMGLFQVGDTHLYVSRGLSGGMPLRWRCPPEIARLVLHPVTTGPGR